MPKTTCKADQIHNPRGGILPALWAQRKPAKETPKRVWRSTGNGRALRRRMGPEHFSQTASAVEEVTGVSISPSAVVTGFSDSSEGLEEVMQPQESDPVPVAVHDGQDADLGFSVFHQGDRVA